MFTQGPPRGWIDPWVIGAGVAAVVFLVAFLLVERTAEHPIVPFSVFDNRSRVMTFVSLFMAGGVMLTATVIIGLYVQDVMGYSALRAGVAFLPFAGAFGLGTLLATRAAPRIAPRWLIIGCGVLVLAAMLYGSTLDRSISYFPDFVVLILVGGFGIGVISVVLPLCAVAEVGPREIGPVSAIQLMVYNLGGPLVLVVIQAVHHIADALPGRHHGTRRRDDAQPARRAGRRLHLLAAVGRRNRGGGRRRGARDRFHRTARSRPRSTPARRSRRASSKRTSWSPTRCSYRARTASAVTHFAT